MPLIDRSYFVGDLQLAKLDNASVQELLDLLIQKREPELLQKSLGYSLYKVFMAGLLVDPVDPKWTNLLLGAEYTDRFGNLQKWDGLLTAPPAQVNAIDLDNQIDVQADAGMVTAQGIPVPVALINRPWRISKRAIGPLRASEYTVSFDGTTVFPTTAIVLNDVFFFTANDLSLEQSTGTVKQSLIANFVYYWYLRQRASNTTDMGEVVGTSENSIVNGMAIKGARAWNEMIDQIHNLWCFLDANRTIYAEWQWQQAYRMQQELTYMPRY